MLLGVQVSTEGKIYEALNRAEALGCNTMQIFARNPQQWRQVFLGPNDVLEFNRLQKEYQIKPLFIHIPYLLNMASPHPKLYEGSIEAYIEDMFEAKSLNADYIVTHMGSHKETSEEAGLKRFIHAINKILEKTADINVGILLENTAGSGSWLGYKFNHQEKVFQDVKDKARLGLCLDTAHAYSAGYDISGKDGLQSLLEEIDNSVGIGQLKLVHLNDTKDMLNSHRDKHEHIGKGNIGLEGMKRIINHPLLRKVPFILETPKKTDKDDFMNLNTVRKLRNK